MPSKTIGQIAIELELATSKFNARLAQIDKRMERFGKKTDKSISFIKKSFGGLLAAATVRRFVTNIIQISDQMTELQGRVKNATRDTNDFNAVWKELAGIAAQTGTELNTTVQIFQRLTLARTELQTTNADMLRFTKTVQQLGVISGASTGALRAGLTQLAQGLSAGVLRAEEFNSIVENIPAVAGAIADGMGLSVGQLRLMVLEGKVLSKDVLAAILSQTGEVNEQMAEMPLTVARATTQLSLAWSLFISQLETSIGLSKTLASVIEGMRQTVEDWTIAANSFDRKIQLIEQRIRSLSQQSSVFGNLFGAEDKIAELTQELNVLNRGQLPDLVRKGKEAGRILNELGGAAGSAADEMGKKNERLSAQEKATLADAAAAAKLTKQYEILASMTAKTASFDETIGGKTGGAPTDSDLERWNQRLDEIQDGYVGIDAATGKIITNQDLMNKQLEEQQRLAELLTITWADVMADTINNVSDAWSSFFLDVFHGKGLKSIEDFLNRVKEMFFQIIAEIAAKWVTSQIFGGLLGIGGAGGLPIIGGGGLGGLLGGASTSAGAGGAAIGGVAVAGAAGATVFPYASVTGAGVGGSIAGTALTGATVGGVATAGAGAATVFPYVSATGTGVGGAIGGTAIGTGAGGAGGGIAASGALAGASGALPVIGAFIVALKLMGRSKKALEFLQENQGVQNYSTFNDLALAGRGAVGTDQAGNFKSFLEQRGALGDTRVQDFEGLGSSFSSRTGKEGDPVVNLQKLYQEMERLKTLLPELEESAKTTFATMNIGAGDLTTALQDGVLTSTEQAQLGFIDLGEMSADQFAKITAAVDSGKLSIDGLTGATRLTHGELGRLGAIGVLSMQEIQTATGLTERQVEHLINSAREAGDAFGSAASQARNLANAVSSVPSISSGNIGNRHSGGSFEVRGKAGVDANLVQFMATQGERVSVETPGSTRRQQSNVDMSEMVGRMDRLISYLEAA